MTTTMKPQGSKQEREAEAANARKVLAEMIDRETIIHTQTRYMKSLTDYVRIFVISPDYQGRDEIQDVTYFVARARGRRLTERGIAYGGGNYSKGLEAADDAWRAVFSEPIPQTGNWRELPSV